MEKLINRVGLSWLYDHIKHDLTILTDLLATQDDKSNLLKKADIRLAHLAKVFYALNISAGVFFVNEFRLALKYLQKDCADYNVKMGLVIKNIPSILDYIEDIIQGYGDLLIYNVVIIDELRAVRSEILFSQCSYIVNSVQQHNISAYPNTYDKNERQNISKFLAIISEYAPNIAPEKTEKILTNIGLIKNELKGTAHYLLWELINGYILLDKNYKLKSQYVINNLLQQIFSSYSNSLFDIIGFEKLAKSVANWIGTLCFHILYCDGFAILPVATKEKILKILIINERKSLTNYMDFAERMQDTDGWILVLDIASELDFAISRLQDCKRKKRLDLNWLIESLQKNIDSCVLTGTYSPLEYYYQTLQAIHQCSTSGYTTGENIEAIEELMLKLIKNIENTITEVSNDFESEEFLSEHSSIDQVNQDAQKALLKEQLAQIEQIITVIASECSVTANFIKESLHKLVNIFNMLAVPAVVNIINNYLDKIKSLEQISPSLKQNTSVFVKYLKEIAKSLYNNRGFAFYLKAAKKLIDSLPFAVIENISEDNIISDEQPKQLQLSDKNKTDDLTEIFFDEANDILENLYQLIDNLSANPADPELINSFSRELHTLKGAGRMVGFTLISDWAHHLEELVAQYSAKVHLCSKQHVEVLHTGVRHISNLLTAYQEKSIPELPKLLKLNFSETDSKSDSKFEDNISQISIATLLKNPPVEKLIQDSKKALPTRQTVRIANDELDSLLDGVCELIIGQHQLAGQINYYKVLADKLKNFTKPSEREFQVIFNNLIELNKNHASLIKNNENNIASVFEKLINLRMVPLNAIRSRLENLVDSIASELHKKIHLNLGKLEGNIDRVVLEQITPILDHMIRNAVDHGIENENARRKFNKNIIGTINLSIYVENNAVLIEISDDGSGIDIEKVLKKAKELKLISTDHTAQTLSNDELISILTSSGFSTKDKGNLTQISGRGIGMDVVKSIVNQLCGVINVETKKHHGSKFTIKIPYSLTKQPLLFIKVCDLIYAIPILIIDETIKINKTELLVNKNDTAVYKDIQVYDMFDLINMDKKDYHACFSEFNQKSEYYNLLVVKYNGSKLGFIVEEFFEIEEAVVRPLPAQMREFNEYMGGTIYKDDQVVLILDLIAILNNYRSKTGVLETGIATATGTDLTQKHKNYNILVLEDSATMRHAIEQYLSGPEYNIIMAVDGADGLKKIKLFNPDLILLDIIMPNMNGLEFLKYIRQQEQFKTTPVIIMTSRDDESYRKIAMQLNVDIYLKKPYDKPKLVNAIEHVLSE